MRSFTRSKGARPFYPAKEDKNIIFVSLKRDINNYLFSLRGDTDKQDRIEYLGYEDFTGFAFYAEYADETLKNKDVAHSPQRSLQVLRYHNGNVVATEGDWYGDGLKGAYCGVYPIPNSAICFGEVSATYLKTNCKRISLQQALAVHPQFFLDPRWFDKK